MTLVWLILIPMLGGLAAWALARRGEVLARWAALAAMMANLLIAVALWVQSPVRLVATDGGPWLLELKCDWIPRFGVSFHLGLDGLSLLMVLLTALVGSLAVACSWTDVRRRVGFFHFNLLWVLAGINGVFLALDLLLFYFFWEVMLVPMYFLIGLWGHERRVYAAVKFFLFTQAAGLLMLLSILGLAMAHRGATGRYSFDYFDLAAVPLAAGTARWLMLGFLAAFLVKLPAVPVHNWLPDAHTEAPTAGSVVLAGLLLKTGAYGLLRFILPMFPGAAAEIAPAMMVLGVVGILYGAIVGFAQSDLKRLVAYTSISHMGFVLLGAFAGGALALQGVVMQIICHALSTGALFIVAGMLYERMHTRDMARMGGLWSVAPRMGGAAMFFALASLGLPGLGSFVAEFLILTGTYKVSVPITIVASLGFVVSAIYSLWIVQRVFHGPNKEDWKIPDLNARETATLVVMIVLLVLLGLYPQPVLDTATPALNSVLDSLSPTTPRTGLPFGAVRALDYPTVHSPGAAPARGGPP
jgi:NADH-quinone oxidoreductase subunit M